MVDIITSDHWLEEAASLDREAMALLSDKKNLDAQNFEQATRLTDAAQLARKNSESLLAIEAKRQEAFGEAEKEQRQTPDVELELAKTGGYKSMGHWFKALHALKKDHIVIGGGLTYWDGEGSDGKARLNPVKDAKALAESVGSTGGFLVPAEFQARLLQVASTQTIVRPRAEIIRMNRRTISIPALEQSEVVSGGFNWFGGIKTYYTEEGGALQESQPTFRQVTLTAHKLTGYVKTSDELLDDSAISLQDFLMGDKGFPGALAHQADYDYLQGDGVGKPTGVIGADCTIVVPRGTANQIGYEDLTAMLSKAMPNSQLVWVMTQSAMNEMLTLQGPSGNPLYLWANAISGAPASLLGYPVIFTDKLPALGTQGDVLLAAFSYYLIGDRQAITMDMSSEENFRNNQVSWRANMRHDGKPWLKAPLSYGRSAEVGQLSPFVVLGDVVT
jgi:HK97 family phage major capsid protein